MPLTYLPRGQPREGAMCRGYEGMRQGEIVQPEGACAIDVVIEPRGVPVPAPMRPTYHGLRSYSGRCLSHSLKDLNFVACSKPRQNFVSARGE